MTGGSLLFTQQSKDDPRRVSKRNNPLIFQRRKLRFTTTKVVGKPWNTIQVQLQIQVLPDKYHQRQILSQRQAFPKWQALLPTRSTMIGLGCFFSFFNLSPWSCKRNIKTSTKSSILVSRWPSPTYHVPNTPFCLVGHPSSPGPRHPPHPSPLLSA